MTFKKNRLPIYFSLLFLILAHSPVLLAQNVLDDIEEEDRLDFSPGDRAPNLVAETIKVISPSKKIFILTNDNKSFSKGDFISLLLGNKLVSRALVAKTNDELLSGIKIVKIYNVKLWKELKANKEVLVLKGDDSYYANLEKKPAENTKKEGRSLKITDEEDLFNSTTLNDDDLSLEEASNRGIKTDNLISAGIGVIDGRNLDSSPSKQTLFNGSWGYQLADNFWGEFSFGAAVVKDYPADGLSSRMFSYSGKIKYTLDGPFFSHIMPYVGYQVIQATSQDAGVDDGSGNQTPDDLALELKKLEDLKKNSLVFGATILKRIVPGWFIRVDLGSDLIGGGLSLEF